MIFTIIFMLHYYKPVKRNQHELCVMAIVSGHKRQWRGWISAANCSEKLPHCILSAVSLSLLGINNSLMSLQPQIDEIKITFFLYQMHQPSSVVETGWWGSANNATVSIMWRWRWTAIPSFQWSVVCPKLVLLSGDSKIINHHLLV